MLDKYYQPNLVEHRIYEKWESDGDFVADPESQAETYSIVIPPPNVTGTLHMGHALNNTLQDILVRFYRMNGKNVLWQPGTDHAGIATEMIVEKQLEKKGVKKSSLSRKEFTDKVWEWKEQSGNQIINQLKRLGCSCDWSRERFTLDKGLSNAVRQVFVKLYNDGLIYKDKRLSNWDPKLQTTISDLEVIQKEVKGSLWFIDYKIDNDDRKITIATTRPETMLGDTAVAVNPRDQRYTDLVGKFAILPFINRKLPIVADDFAKMDQGTGAVKITPAHDFNDYELSLRHNLQVINILDKTAKLNENCPKEYVGLDRFNAREKIVNELEKIGALNKIEENIHTVPYGDRSGEIIEPLLTDQWFVDAKKLSIDAIKKVKEDKTQFIPKNWEKTYFEWMKNIQPWCISRQLLWGHQIPAWYGPDNKIFVAEKYSDALSKAKEHYKKDIELVQDKDVLDTWFSSALWPFSTLGWPEKTIEYNRYYPTTALVTGFDIIFFWVARMMMMGLYFTKQVPFKEVYVHALVRDEHGQKMSKSKGNVIDPLVLMDEYGADALRMALCSMAAQGRDIKLSKKRIEGYRNFITKIWNAAKFCDNNNCKYEPIDFKKVKNPFNLWILSKYNECRELTELSIKNYRFNEAANELYKFTWSIFCDWYLEFTKAIYSGDKLNEISETRSITSFIFSNILIMFHPIMPFFTQHLWSIAPTIFKQDSTKINKSSWPEKVKLNINDTSEIELLIELISSIRSTRSEMNVPANKFLDLNYWKGSDKIISVFNNYEPIIFSLSKIKKISRKKFSKGEGMVQVLFNDVFIYLTLKGVVDLKEEKLRLNKSLGKISFEIQKIENKLNNVDFVENAPRDVIDEQKDRKKLYLQSQEKILNAIKSIE